MKVKIKFLEKIKKIYKNSKFCEIFLKFYFLAPGIMGGDLHVRIKIKPHKVFTRKGTDLFIEKKITLL